METDSFTQHPNDSFTDVPGTSNEKLPDIQEAVRGDHSKALILEVFSGTCRLSSACKRTGLRVLPIDKDPQRSENMVVANFDLTNPDQFSSLKDLIGVEKEFIVHAHFAPSCGTSSRARNFKIPGVKAEDTPKPLRSETQPDGLKGLEPGDSLRVQKANKSYIATAVLVDIMIQAGISVSIENPANSLFWLTSWIKTLLQKHLGHETVFHNCMHGGTRDKLSKFWSFNPRDPKTNLLESLSMKCDGQHQHESWKPRQINGKLIFPTKEEAAYPVILCDRLASIFLKEAEDRGFKIQTSLADQTAHDLNIGKRHLFSSQTRTKKLHQPVSEFGDIVDFAVPFVSRVHIDNLESFPKGSKILSRRIASGFFRDVFIKETNNPKVSRDLKDGDHFYEILRIGVPRTPEDFLRAALKVGHPKHLLKRVGPDLAHAIELLVDTDKSKLERIRANFLKKWTTRALELKQDEMNLHATMPQHLQAIMKGKRLCLWKEILIDLGYPDVAIIDEAAAGFDLTGWSTKSGVFETNVRAPELSVKQLDGMAVGLNSAVVSSLKGQDWADIDKTALEETELEVSKGWLRPCNEINLKKHYIAKRFPLQQKDKVRLIDDFSICGVNSTFGLQEKLRVETIDEMVACLLVAMDKKPKGKKRNLVGRCFDLKSAYKQFGVSEEQSKKLKIAIKKSQSEIGFFDVLALPFGATGSVAAFLRLAASIAFIGVAGLGLTWTVFFDDFTCVTTEDLKDNTSFYAESLFRLLGMSFAAEGPKAPPFDSVFKTLGLQVDVSCWSEDIVLMEHTEARKKELASTIENMLQGGTSMTKQLERLHGRLVWFNSYIFGRRINHAVRAVSKYARASSAVVKLNVELRDALQFLLEAMSEVRPLKIRKCLSTTWIIFTDGAYEPEAVVEASVGGLIVHPQGAIMEFFGEGLPTSLTSDFTADSKHPIYELEIFPIMIAMALWEKHLTGSHVVCYLDNDAARSSLVRGTGATTLGQKLIDLTIELEDSAETVPWFARVPTSSNPADEVSRLCFDGVLFKNSKRSEISLPEHLKDWGIYGCSEKQTIQ